MKKKIPGLEDLFTSGIDGYKEMPPEDVWNSLDAALDKSNAIHKRFKLLKRWSPLLLLLLAFVVFLLKQADLKEPSDNKSEEKTGLTSDNSTPAHANEQKNLYSKNKTTNPKKPATTPGVTEKEITAGNRLKVVSGVGELNPSISQFKIGVDRTAVSKAANKQGLRVAKRNSESNNDNGLVDINGLNKISTSKQSVGRQTPAANNDKLKIPLNVRSGSEILTNGDATYDLAKNKKVSVHIDTPSLPAANKQNKRYNAPNDTLPYHAFYKPNLAFTPRMPPVVNDRSNNGKAVTGQNMKSTNNKETRPAYVERKGQVSATTFYSPNFNFSFVKSHMPVEKEDDKDRIKQKEQYSFSSAIGVLGDYNISPQWGLQTGFVLSNTVIEIGAHTIYARQERRATGNAGSAAIKYRINSSAGFAYLPSKISAPLQAGDSIRTTNSSNALQYASIPIVVKNHMTGGKISFAPVAGLWINFLSKQKFETTLEKGGVKENIIVKRMEGIRPVYFSAMVGCSFEYNVGKTVELHFTPVTHIALSSITKDGPVKTYHNSISLMTGVRIKL